MIDYINDDYINNLKRREVMTDDLKRQEVINDD